MNKLLQLIVQLKDEASAGLGSLRGALEGVGGVAGGVLLAGVAAASAAIVGLGASSISVAADFQNATATFASVAGGSLAAAGFTLDDVKNKALDMGAQTAFSAAQAQEAMIALAKGGVPIADVMGAATDATLALASAGELELGPAADIVAKQLGVWGETGVTAAQVADLMAQAANASTVDVDELALGLANVGGVAKASGVSFQDLTQTMAMIAPGFSSAADAGTSLKTMILSMQPTTKSAADAFSQYGLMAFDAAKAAKQFGIDISNSGDPLEEVDAAMRKYIESTLGIKQGTEQFNKAYDDLYSKFEYSKFYDASGQFIGMDKAAALLQDSLGGLSEAEQSAALKAMFGTDAFRAASIVVNQGASGFEAMGAAMDSAGTAAEQAAIRNQTFKFAWDSLLGTIETIQIVIGSALLPILTSLVNDGLIPAGNALLALVQTVTSSSDPLATLVAAIDSVLPGFSAFVGFVSANLLPIMAALGAMILAVVVPPFYAWATAAITSAVATAIAFLPVTLAIAAVGLAVGLLVAAWQNDFGGIQEITASVWATIQPYLQQLWAWLQVNIPAAIAVLVAFWSGTLWPALQAVGAYIVGTVIPALLSLYQYLSTTVPAGVAVVVAAVTGFVAAVVGFATSVQNGFMLVVSTVTGAWASIVAAAQSAWSTVSSTVMGAINTLASVIGTAIYVIVTIVTAAWNTVNFITQAIWGAIWSYIGPPLTAAAALVAAGVAAIVGYLSAGWAFVSSTTSAAWSALSAIVGSALATAGAVVSSVVATIVAVLSSAWATVASVSSSVWSTVQGVVSAAVSAVSAVVSSVVASIVSTVSSAWASTSSSTSSTWAQVQSVINTVMTAVRVAIATAVAIVNQIVTAGWAIIVAASQNNFSQIPAIAQRAWDSIKAIFAAGVDAIKGVMSSAAAQAVELGRNIVQGIVNGISAAGSAIGDKLKSLASSALSAAKSVLGIHSPSAVMAQQVGVPIVDGIVQGLKTASPKATAAMLDLGNKLLDVVSKGVDAFGKLSQLGTIPQSSIDRFAQSLQAAMSTFGAMTLTWNKAMMSAASQFTQKSGQVVELMAKGVDFLLKLSQLGPIAPGAFTAFAAGLAQAIRIVLDLAQRQTLIALTGAVGFAEGAGKIVAVIGTGVDAFGKLHDFVAPSLASFDQFSLAMGRAMGYVIRVANWFVGQPMAAATAFAESTGKIITVIGTGVDAFAKLEKFSAPAAALFDQFSLAMVNAAGYVIRVANWFVGQPLAAAVSFAESAGKIISIIGNGVDSLAKLNTYKGVTAAAVALFVQDLGMFVGLFTIGVRNFNVEALAPAAAFADAAGKIVGVVGSGVDGLSKLADFTGITGASVVTFIDALSMFVGLFAIGVRNFDVEALAQSTAFADSAGKIVGVIGGGVEGLSKLGDLKPVAEQSIALFVQLVGVLVTRIAAAATGFSADALTQASAFSDAAGAAVKILADGVEGFLKVDTFVGVSAAAIDRFGAGVQLAVAKMAALAAQFGPDATAAANSFAKAAGESTDFLKKGVDGFNKLGELESVPVAGLALFEQGVIALITTIANLSTLVSTDVLAQALRFAVGMDQVISVTTGAIKAFDKLAPAGMWLEAFIAGLSTSVAQILSDFAGQVTPPSVDIGTNIARGIAQGIGAGVPAIVNATYAAVQASITAARTALGIASPSKVFDQIGQYSGQGLAAGFAAQQQPVAAAAGALARATVAPVVAAGAGIAQGASGAAQTSSSSSSSAVPALTLASGAIVIQQQPGENADKLAQRVLALLESKYRSKLG